MAAGITLCGSLSRWAVPLGAAMHNAAYRALALPWHYVPFEVSDLGAALAAMRVLGIRGFGISMPFKRDILPLLDTIEPTAERIGAVNTVVNDAGRLEGHNTDWWGARRALEDAMELTAKRVLVLGAGGAARAVGHGLLAAGAEVVVCNRSEARARELADELGVDQLAWRARHELAGFAAVVNATSLGMKDVDETSPLSDEAFHAGLTVMDIVYKPVTTRLLAAARAGGAKTIHGGRMLLHQAARQFELYTGRDAPLAAMDAALRETLGEATAET
jgi:shikimate dehydrogenase